MTSSLHWWTCLCKCIDVWGPKKWFLINGCLLIFLNPDINTAQSYCLHIATKYTVCHCHFTFILKRIESKNRSTAKKRKERKKKGRENNTQFGGKWFKIFKRLMKITNALKCIPGQQPSNGIRSWICHQDSKKNHLSISMLTCTIQM